MKRVISTLCAGIFFIASMTSQLSVYSISYDVSDYGYPFEILSDSAYYSGSVDASLWDRFIKYDLGINDYELLSESEKELCKWIFDRERTANTTIRCERARKELLKEYIPLNVDYLENTNGMDMIPDIVHLDSDMRLYEYFLDENGLERLLLNYNGTLSPAHLKNYDELQQYIDSIDTSSLLKNSSYQLIPLDKSEIGEEMMCVIMQDKTAWKCELLSSTQLFSPKETIEKDGVIYALYSDGTASAVGNTFSNNDNNELLIPESIDGHIVKSIAGNAFARSGITKAQLPDSVEMIGAGAFQQCEMLKTISFPKQLKHIAEFALADCHELKRISINCPELTIDAKAFAYDNGLETVKINVDSIGENAFINCDKLIRVKIGDDVRVIHAGAFENCTALTNVMFGKNVKTLGQGTFLNTSINSITIDRDTDLIGTLYSRRGKYDGDLYQMPATDPLTEEDICVFDKSCKVYGYKNTETENYTKKFNLKFVPLDDSNIPGDADLDGGIGISDVVVVAKYDINSITYPFANETAEANADMNNDNVVDGLDTSALVEYNLGKK